MNAVKFTKYIAGMAMVMFTLGAAQAQESESSEALEAKQRVEQIMQTDDKHQIMVVKENGKTATIDLDGESGSIVINADGDDGEQTHVSIDLGGIGKTIIAEIAEDLKKEGIDGEGPIKIEIDGEDNVVVKKGSKKEIVKRHIKKGSSSSGGRSMGFMESIVAITAIVLIFGTPLLIVAVVMYARHKRHSMVHKNIDKLIDSGRDIPPEIFQEATGRGGDPRRKGLIWVAMGLGIMLCLSTISSPQVGSLGLIPLMIGIANLLIWKTEPKNDSEA